MIARFRQPRHPGAPAYSVTPPSPTRPWTVARPAHVATGRTPSPSPLRGGAAAVELAVLLPFLMFLALLSTDWARLLYHTTALESVARNGALYASGPTAQKLSPYYTGPSDTQVAADTRVAALAETPDLSPTPTISDPVYTTDGSGNKLTVRVTATMTFNTVGGLNLSPLFVIPSSQQITRVVEMRMAPK